MESLSAAMDAAIEAKDLDRAIALRELVKKVEGLNAGNVTEAAIANQPEEAKSEAVNNKLEGKGIVPISGEVIVATPLGTRWHYRFDRNWDGRILSWTLPNERSKPFPLPQLIPSLKPMQRGTEKRRLGSAIYFMEGRKSRLFNESYLMIVERFKG